MIILLIILLVILVCCLCLGTYAVIARRSGKKNIFPQRSTLVPAFKQLTRVDSTKKSVRSFFMNKPSKLSRLKSSKSKNASRASVRSGLRSHDKP